VTLFNKRCVLEEEYWQKQEKEQSLNFYKVNQVRFKSTSIWSSYANNQKIITGGGAAAKQEEALLSAGQAWLSARGFVSPSDHKHPLQTLERSNAPHRKVQ